MSLISIAASEAAKLANRTNRFEKIVIVNPPRGYGQLYPQGAPIPVSLDVPYLVGYLTEKSIPMEVLEAQGLDLECDRLASLVADIAGQQPPQKTLVVVRVALCCLDWDLSVCSAIKKAAPGIRLAIYGSIIPQIRQRLEEEVSVDYVLRGEPDETVCALAAGEPDDGIAGLDFRGGDGWISNPSRPLIKDLDKLPFPKWELLPYHRYTLPKSSATAAVPYLPMLTSRGCPFGCHYCPYPVTQGLPFRFRSPQNVVDEIEHLSRDLGIRYIIFRDPMFSLRQDRVIAMCKEIQRRGLSIRWKCETRIDCLNETTLRAMAAAGCEGINFGIESAEVEIQANVGRKPITQGDILKTVALCRQLGIRTFGFFIIGLPGDTVYTILGTIDFAIRLRPTWVQFNAATPLIGTKLRTWAIDKGLTSDSELSYGTSHEGVIGNENLTKDQVSALQKFAVFLERYLMNRGGILKDETRTGILYCGARFCADWVANLSARAVFAIGRSYFERSPTVAAPPQGQGAT